MMKIRILVLAVFSAAAGFFIPTAEAGIVFEASGLSGKGVAVSFRADLSIFGDLLTLVLTNTSPADSLNPDDMLSSFYFDILSAEGDRPAMTYTSATGDVYLVSKTEPDLLIEADADIMAVVAGDRSWMFRTMDETAEPFLGFGIGTVGNSNLAPNNFNGRIVGGMDYSIYKGEITTRNLDGKQLVRETTTFTFGGLTGFTEADIAPQFAFGLGTAPDSLLTPEPATITMLFLGSMIFLRTHRS